MVDESKPPPSWVQRPQADIEASVDGLLSAMAAFPSDEVAPLRLAVDALRARKQETSPPINVYHAIETARVLANMRLDPPAVIAALVAPLVIRLGQPLDELQERYGAEVRILLDGVVRLSQIRWHRLEDEAAETLRAMFLAMARDIRVVLIVLAERVLVMRSLRDGGVSDEDAERIARETLEVFAPLANRLGIWQLKWELEDWSLRTLDPEAFLDLTRSLNERREERQAFIGEVVGVLRDKLVEDGIEASVKGRPKHIYSIYKKMQRKQLSFEQIYDVSAVRVVTKRIPDCYAALGMVHSLWVPVPNEFDDYIAKPKSNGYQSLHTAVIGPGGRPIEVQIRTEQMHELSEFGVAAHWAYKESKKSAAHDNFMVLRRLMDWERDLSDPHEFVESLKTDVFEDQVYVFTPNGDIVDLPLGSTPLDFAYRIHTMVGHRFRGARVNDHIQPLDYQLKTGDRIEILTQKQPSPSRDWMNPAFGHLKTSSARHKVRQWFRKQGRDEAISQGREVVDKELSRLDLHHATLVGIAEALKYTGVEDLYAHIGYGDRSVGSVASTALLLEREQLPPEEPPLPPSVAPSQKKRSASGLSLDGVDDILGKRARCCNPVPGDKVLGFVTRGRGIMIHRRDCNNIVDTKEPERLVDIDWGPERGERHTVDVEIRANDRRGLLSDLTNLVTNAGVNITAVRAEGSKGEGWLRMSLEFSSAEQVVSVLQRIDRHRDVLEVRRVAR
jgi:RelA/SpoT family (p)ppGpp synthetase